MTTRECALLGEFFALDSESVSDALDSLGLPSGFGGIAPMWGQPRVVGWAATVEVAPRAGQAVADTHIAATAVAVAGHSHIMVVANAGRIDVSCWGGLLSLGASRRGISGVVVDGACRDVDEARQLGFPVFARATTPRTARGRLKQVSAGDPVVVEGTRVAAGDVVIADETGVAIVPRSRAGEVLAAAQRLADRERSIAGELRTGSSLPQVMHDARLDGTEQGPS